MRLLDRSPLRGMMLALLLAPIAAQAHVKWFCGPIDQELPPVPLREVLSPLFLDALAAFAALVVVGAMIDALIGRFVTDSIIRPERATRSCDVIVRLGLSAYALSLWTKLALVMWAVSDTVSILTPDLLSGDRIVGYLQLAIAIAVLIPRLSLAAAAGLVLLYGMGVADVGPFYMTDYLFFLGLATYVALGDPLLRRYVWLEQYRVPILIGSLSISLMWTAVEKFLFPQWTIAVLVRHPSIAAGLAFPAVATIAGFVEFSLAFYLLAGREVLGRIGAILLLVVFFAAMPEFGILDVVGHIPVIVILIVALITGETPLQIVFHGRHPHIVRAGLRVGLAMVLTLATTMSLYYGLHALMVWA